jgi:ubiquinol-cytochrome c reductase cytochrome b subunit
VIRRIVRYLDSRSGTAPYLRKGLRYVFPDHWSFMFGEIALYAFIVLVATGIYLTLFFDPSIKDTVYHGPYAPLEGQHMSQAYKSVLDISFTVKAGLLIRQTHHWAADVFVAAIVVHMLRVFFTGAFRKPRELTWYIGVSMLGLSVFEGFLGYSLGDDLLSGMGLAIAYSVALSIPFFGANLGLLVWGGPFPGSTDFLSRMYVFHILFIPVVIGVLLTSHLLLVALRHHTQFAGPRAREDNVVGTPAWPGYALRTSSLMLAVAGVLFLVGGLVQINPVWEWGPFETALSTNGAQPDWYLGWLIGGLRLMPGWEPHAWGYTFVPNPFWGGAFFPLLVFGFLFLWPAIEKRMTGDRSFHQLLDRPRDAPWRTGVGAAFFTWVAMVFFAGSSDRVFVQLHIPYESQVRVYEGALFVVPFIAFWVTRRVCEELRVSGAHPLRGTTAATARRTQEGGFTELAEPNERSGAEP